MQFVPFANPVTNPNDIPNLILGSSNLTRGYGGSWLSGWLPPCLGTSLSHKKNCSAFGGWGGASPQTR